MRQPSSFTSHHAIVTAAILYLGLGGAAAGQDAANAAKQPKVWTQPARRAPDPPPAPPPELPAGAGDVEPVTLSVAVETRRVTSQPHTERRVISRTADRVHVRLSGGREWLFERNPLDHRRVSGVLVAHDSKTIIAYSDSDLRDALGVRGWADLLTLRFDTHALEGMNCTEEARTIEGIRFVRYATDRSESPVKEVWWSADEIFPATILTSNRDGTSSRFTVENIHKGVDAELLREPSSRFPRYRTVDFADSLESN